VPAAAGWRSRARCDLRRSGRPRPAITTLDLELLEAFAETASLWLAARRSSDLLAGGEGALHWDAIVAAHEAEA